VILEVEPRTLHTLHAVPVMVLRTKRKIKLQESAGITLLRLDNEAAAPFLLVDVPLSPNEDGDACRSYLLKAGIATEGRPSRCFFRFPQEGQEIDKLKEGLETPDRLLAEARQYWQNWKPFEGKVSWQLPGRHGEFLVACACNLQQAREEKAGRMTFQVGPTVYRGLWVGDGNFILEAARYLGYDLPNPQNSLAGQPCQSQKLKIRLSEKDRRQKSRFQKTYPRHTPRPDDGKPPACRPAV